MEGELDSNTLGAHVGTAVWIVASLLGPVPWVLLLTLWLENVAGLDGYSVGFVGAPVWWTGLAIAAFLWRRPWATAAWAVFGIALWLAM